MKSVMRDGYAYIPSYDLTGVYKINIGNRYLALLTPYMASICNLGSAVMKTSDMTMKITYTLTEVDSKDDSTDDTDDSDESLDQ